MISILEDVAEQGTLHLDVDVTDKNDNAVVPIAFTWTLTDRNKQIINEREDVVETPASTVALALTGDDLQILDDDSDREYRLLTIKTDEGNANLPQNIQIQFWIENLKASC